VLAQAKAWGTIFMGKHGPIITKPLATLWD